MPFEKVETQQVNFPAQERRILELWERISAFDKLKAKGEGKPIWSFLDGPITANNPMGVHHAWGRTYKDVYNRFFAMTGHQLRWQQGFDCQGLWVEVEVEKELGLKSKRDIENLVPGDVEASLAKFTQACKDRVNKFARIQTEQSIRLGYWMDWDRTDDDWAKSPDERKSYFTMAEENNYTIWAFLKKCFDKGLIYRGYDVMPWCGRCGVGISEQEMKEGYKYIEHKAVFVKFPLLDKPGENLLVWTTTPWTLTSNVAAAVNPKLTYLQVKLKDEIYYVAKGAFKHNRMESTGDGDDEAGEASGKKGKREWIEGVPHLSSIEQMFKAKAGKDGYEIVGEVKGEDLIGRPYTGPFDEVEGQNHPFGFPQETAEIVEQRKWCDAVGGAKSHRVIAWEDVGETEGAGIVHIAPGCGKEDFELGKKERLPFIAPLDESGTLLPGFGKLSGQVAYTPKCSDVVFEELKEKGRLFQVERYVHRYPHCWRCKTELLFRLVDEWFINMGPQRTEEGFRGDIMKVVNQVTFLPESINGRAREYDWLWQMGDWMISKKRFWGLALPIWVDEKEPTQFEVIGSREELKARAVEGWTEFDGQTPHRPWVDKIVIINPRTGNKMRRIPDVGNPWLDAGIVAFSTMKYNSDREYWNQHYPADFITESFPGQFRNWFYALLALSTMMSDGKAPFKTLLGFATARDQWGREMHKSAGNSIEFVGAADNGFELKDPKDSVLKFEAIGADVMRWLYCRHNPASNLNFGPGPADEVRSKVILKLWNSYALLCNFASGDGFDPQSPSVPLNERSDIDRWILSDLQQLIDKAHTSLKAYNAMAFCLEAESFIDDRLSNWYIRVNKDRFWSKVAELDEAGRKDKTAAYQTLYTVMTTLCKLLAPIVPFLSETMWQNLRTANDPESVHLCDYPVSDASAVDAVLSADMDSVLRIVSLGLSARQGAKIKVRQPLAELKVQPATDADRRAVERFSELMIDELNIKKVSLHDGTTKSLLKATSKLNKKTAASKLGAKLKEAESALSGMNALELASQLKNGPVEIVGVALEATDINIEFSGEAGWLGVVDKETQVAIDTTVTDELKLEGLARDTIRLIQNARKDAGLNLSDQIRLTLNTSSATLMQAIDAHRGAIATAAQVVEWPTEAPTGGYTTTAKVEGQELQIALAKA